MCFQMNFLFFSLVLSSGVINYVTHCIRDCTNTTESIKMAELTAYSVANTIMLFKVYGLEPDIADPIIIGCCVCVVCILETVFQHYNIQYSTIVNWLDCRCNNCTSETCRLYTDHIQYRGRGNSCWRNGGKEVWQIPRYSSWSCVCSNIYRDLWYWSPWDSLLLYYYYQVHLFTVLRY